MFNNLAANRLQDSAADGDEEVTFYQPTSDETKKHYERLLTLLRKLGADNNSDISLHVLADDVIDICKDADIAFVDRRSELEKLTGVKISADDVRNISGTCDKLTDYVQSTARQNLIAATKNKDNAAVGGDGNQQQDLLFQEKRKKDLLSFSVGDVFSRSAYERRGGAGAVGINDDDIGIDDFTADVDALLDSNDDDLMQNQQGLARGNKNNNKRGGINKNNSLQLQQYHPRTMHSSLLTDQLTKLFPDMATADRLAVESDLRANLGNMNASDDLLRTQLPMRINPFSKPQISRFLTDVIDHRWHVHYGLMLADINNNNGNDDNDDLLTKQQKREAVIDELREIANAKVSPGDRTGYIFRQKVRGVLKLISGSEKDQFEEDEFDNNGGENDEDNNNNNLLTIGDNEDGAAAGANRRKRIQRRGEELNIIEYSTHHPMTGGANKAAAASNQVTSNLVLPENTETKQFDNYTEVRVPQPERARVTDKDRLKITVAFPEWAHGVFPKGTTSLNAMQSKVYDSVFKSDRNALICAPTGAGKTNVAIMACLRAVEQYAEFEQDPVSKALHCTGAGSGWKIIYIAPMVALAREVVSKLKVALGTLNVNVEELSGDSALSQQEMKNVHVLVATPEKWDIVSRKTLDLGASNEVKLIIFDEIHMLHSERGAVVESIAARTLQQVQRTGNPVRFIGLSATLPNYEDVAQFLRVNVAKGDLHFFHGGYRPCPLTQTFVCPDNNNKSQADKQVRFLSKKNTTTLEELAYLKITEMLEYGPIMVFVHSRKDTIRTANYILEQAVKNGFQTEIAKSVGGDERVQRAKARALGTLLPNGIGVHHAGLTLDDKRLVEDLFSERKLQVLVCTATLAWGVNLPAHTVIIKGTKIYSASNGGWTDLSILDTLQMFGRAGRPGHDDSGDAIILTSDRENLVKYLKFLTVQDPVESHLLLKIMEAINAEVALGSVANLQQCVKWFKYTWYYTRMRAAPRLYGILPADLSADPTLTLFSEDLCHTTLKNLHACELVVYDDIEGTCHPTDLGRITSFFNLSFATTQNIVRNLRADMYEHEMFDVFAGCQEFAAIRVRDEELEELRDWRRKCPMPIDNNDERDSKVKVNILCQLAISNARLEGRNLASDLELIKDSNSTRITKAIHEIALIKGWANTATLALKLHQQLFRKQWYAQCPLRQFGEDVVGKDLIRRLEASRADWTRLVYSDSKELEQYVSDPAAAEECFEFIHKIPQLLFVKIVTVAQSRAFLKLEVALEPDFAFDEELHPTTQPINFLLTIEDGDGTNILFAERISLSRSSIENGSLITVPCFVRLRHPKPSGYFARCVAVDWIGSTTTQPIDLRDLVQPDAPSAPTKPAPIPESEDDYPHINDAADHEALFGHLAQDGWNSAQLTAFNSLFKRRTNTVISCPLGSGREAMTSLIVAQFLENCDAVEDIKTENAGSDTAILSTNTKRLLFVSPQLDAAQRRFNFYKNAMKVADEIRTSPENGKSPRNVQVKFLTGVASVDSKHIFSSNNNSNEICLVFSTPIRLLRLSSSYPEIFDAFDVCIFDHLHTICQTPFPKSGFFASSEEAESSNNNLTDEQCFNYFASPNSSLWASGTSEGGSVRYAELVQRFVESLTAKTKQVSKLLNSNNNNNNSLQIASLLLNRIVGFTSITTHAENILGKFLKVSNTTSTKKDETLSAASAPGVIQLKHDPTVRTIALEVQEIPRFEDREASAKNHVFRLLTEKKYVASSVLVFTPNQRQANEMAEQLMEQYRSVDTILHPDLKLKNDFVDAAAKLQDGSSGVSSPLQDPLLQAYCPSGVAVLSAQTSVNDFNIILKTSRVAEKMVCFVPMELAWRIPSGCFRHCFICFSQLQQVISPASQSLSSQSPVFDVDVPTMLQMSSRSAAETIVWCSTSRRDFWNRALEDFLPCLPLLSTSLAPSFRPFLQSYREDEDKMISEMMPHFVAENLLEYALTETCLIASSTQNSVNEQALFSRIQKNICFAAAMLSPFAYGIQGGSQTELLDFFTIVMEKIFTRLNGLRAVRKQLMPLPDQQDNEDGAFQGQQQGISVLTPTVFGKTIANYQLSVVDCGRIFDFFSDPSRKITESSLLLLACQLSVVSVNERLVVTSSERPLLRRLMEYFVSKQKISPSDLIPASAIENFVASTAGKAFLLVQLFCTGKLCVAESTVLLASSTSEQQQHSPSVLLEEAFSCFSDFLENEENFSALVGRTFPASEWILQLSQIVENLLCVIPALVDIASKKDASSLQAAVNLHRSIVSGSPLVTGASSSSSAFLHLPGFERSTRLEVATQQLGLKLPQDIASELDDEQRDKLFAGLSESAIESIAEWCNACPVIQTTAVAKFDVDTEVVAIRCIIESAFEEQEAENGGGAVASLPLVACTPRLTHVLRLAGRTTFVENNSGGSDHDDGSSSLPSICVASKFVVSVFQKTGSSKLIKSSRIVTLTNPREVVDMRFKQPNVGENEQQQFIVEVKSLAYPVDSTCFVNV